MFGCVHVPDLLVLTQDEILKKPNIAIRKIENFCGTTINSGINVHSKANVSVKTALQINFLRGTNRINQQLIKIHPRLNLYNRMIRKIGFSPRQIAQGLLSRIPGQKVELDFGHSAQEIDSMKSDWEAIKLKFIND